MSSDEAVSAAAQALAHRLLNAAEEAPELLALDELPRPWTIMCAGVGVAVSKLLAANLEPHLVKAVIAGVIDEMLASLAP